jgi:two-component sensor histidine kinase
MRTDLHTTLASWGLADLVEVAALLATELFANALRHGAPLPGGSVDVRARVRHDGDRDHLRVEVIDAAADSAALVRVRDAAGDDEGGRGLSMVEMLAEGWGVVASATRKGVWFELAAA